VVARRRPSRSREMDVLSFLPLDVESVAEASGRIVIAVDILRATSTIVAALDNGAARVVPVLTPEEALSLFDPMEPSLRLGGEREGLRLEGFHYGNSPSEYTADSVRDATILFTTTNGTRLLRACTGASRILIGCFANLSAVVDAVRSERRDVLIACAGTAGRLTIEDMLFAGACVSRLADGSFDPTDSATTAAVLWESLSNRLVESMASGRHGRTLDGIGLGEDIRLCARIDTTTTVPEVAGNTILKPSRRAGGKTA